MTKIILALFLSLTCLLTHAADRITLTVTVTNTPSDGNTLVINSATRTWKTSVATPATQILIGAAIGAHATNLFSQIAANPYAGPLNLLRSGTNAIQLIAEPGNALTASLTGTWGTLTLSTQTVTSAYVVRVPLSVETAGIRDNIADGVIDGVFNAGYATDTVDANSAVMVNFVDTSENQTVGGNKSFTGANTYANASQLFNAGSITNVTFKTARFDHDSANPNGLYFYSSVGGRISAIAPDANGIPTIYGTIISEAPVNELGAFTPSGGNILTRNAGDTRYGSLTAANAWTGTNTFTRITNSAIVGGSINVPSISGTVANLTNGTYTTPTLISGVNTGGNPFESYTDDSRNVELGSGAVVTNGFVSAIALGYNAKTGGNFAQAFGRGSQAKYDNSIALGYDVATAAAGEIRLGNATNFIVAPKNVYITGKLAIGVSAPTVFDYTYAAGDANYLFFEDSTADLGAPSTGAIVWSKDDELKYRSAGTSEGSAAVNRVHNRAYDVIGSGSDYSFSGTSYADVDFGGTDPSIDIGPGTFLIIAIVTITNGGTASDVYNAKLRDTTTPIDIPSSERTISHLPASTTGQIVIVSVWAHTDAGNHTIILRAQNSTAARGSVIAAKTSLTAVRLF